jgi:hypothetical protein
MAVFTELEREQVKRLGADRVAAPKQDLRTLWTSPHDQGPTNLERLDLPTGAKLTEEPDQRQSTEYTACSPWTPLKWNSPRGANRKVGSDSV